MRCRRRVIALIEGAAMGGGVGLVAIADWAIAERSAQIGTPEVTVGLVPAQIAPFLVARIGYTQARRLASFGLRLGAEEALRIGLVHELADGRDDLLAKGAAAVNQVLRCAPEAVAETKKLVRASLREPLGPTLDAASHMFAAGAGRRSRARAFAPSSRSASRPGRRRSRSCDAVTAMRPHPRRHPGGACTRGGIQGRAIVGILRRWSRHRCRDAGDEPRHDRHSAPSWSPTAARSRAASCARPRPWAIARPRSIPTPTRTHCTCARPMSRRASGRRKRARAISTSPPSSPPPSTLGADAVHPGYGFLSENADFARACAEAGLVFIGPSPDAIAAMGNKAAAKRRMLEAGVPCVPGYQGGDQSDATLAREAERIGFPVMVKAAAGGGGRGMRLVAAKKELARRARHGARAEAESAFGSGELILEKAVVGGRHVEIQVLADTHGHVIHLGERDCSVQRRHQKVLEEAPSPAVDPGLARAHGRRRRRCRPGHRLQQRRHGRVPAGAPTGPSTSWR